MENQSVHAMHDFEQTSVVDVTDNEITSDSNIISYSQYLQETQQANVQDTNLQAQQDSMILSVIEQMSEQMINHVNNWEKANKEQNNESVTAELERYKERVKTFKQHLIINLSSHEKMIDSQMDDMIKEKLALKEQVDSLKQNLSKQIKEKESLLQTFTVFKNESKEKENKYMENEIDLEKKIKELDNIIFKVGQSAQTVHMLTKPQVFYDNIHKQALGYQNPFYLKKAQRIKPTLYDGIVISDKHVAMPVIDDEETLILEEEKLTAEQAFWFHISNPTIISSVASPVKIEAPKELPKVSLVNKSLKNLKFHIAKFDSVVKIRTTLDARTEELLLENDRLLQQIMSQDVLLTMMNSMSLNGESVNMERKRNESCDKCFNLDAELLKTKNAHNDLLKSYSQLEKHCMFKLDLEPLAPRLLQNREAHIDYLKYTQEQADILRDIVEQAKAKQPLDNKLDVACKHAQQIQELLVYVRDTCPNAIKLSAKKVTITSKNNVKKVRIEVFYKKVNKKNRVVEPIRDVDVKPSLLKANFELICATCKKSMFDGVHDMCSSKKAKIVESKNANHSEPNHTWGSNATDIPSSSSLVMTGIVRFGNDHIARIMGYGDYQLGNVPISRVYYVEGLGHNFRNLEGVDLLSGSRDKNLYTISLDDMLKTSPICLLSKASKTKNWLWHRRLSHLNFGTLNKLAKDGLTRGIPRLKFQKDHLCSACALEKSKKSSHQPKAKDTNQEKLYLLHMDLCGPMHVASINRKMYILVIVDDYLRFTWVRFLRTKDVNIF
ncbi:retrovirus-related pol polyprotein from transposon TNT 1-94 [Tanacetum coccineum]